MFYRFYEGALNAATKVWAPGYTLDADEYIAACAGLDRDQWPPLPDGWIWADTEDEARTALGLDPIETILVREATRFQVRAALLQAGLLDAIDAFIEQNGDSLTKLAWKEGNAFSPDSAVVKQMAAAFGLSEAEVEQLFVTAKQIVL